VSEELQPARLVLLHALVNSEDFAISFDIHTDRHQRGSLLSFAMPRCLVTDLPRIVTVDRLARANFIKMG